jgi:hypothetical protein
MALTLNLSLDGGSNEPVRDFSRPTTAGSYVKRHAVASRQEAMRTKVKFDDSGTDDYGIRAAALYGESIKQGVDIA